MGRGSSSQDQLDGLLQDEQLPSQRAHSHGVGGEHPFRFSHLRFFVGFRVFDLSALLGDQSLQLDV